MCWLRQLWYTLVAKLIPYHSATDCVSIAIKGTCNLIDWFIHVHELVVYSVDI